jgi:hypothetical protein
MRGQTKQETNNEYSTTQEYMLLANNRMLASAVRQETKLPTSVFGRKSTSYFNDLRTQIYLNIPRRCRM